MCLDIHLPSDVANVSTNLSDVPYEMTVFTSDVMGAGTSAHVYIVLYGSDGCTEEIMLADTSKKQKDSFKRGSTDQFVKEVCVLGLEEMYNYSLKWR